MGVGKARLSIEAASSWAIDQGMRVADPLKGFLEELQQDLESGWFRDLLTTLPRLKAPQLNR